MVPAYLSVFNADRGIGTETYEVDNVFHPDDLWFGSDTNTNCAVIHNGYLDV